MQRERSSLVGRAVGSTVLALADVAAFVFAWAAEDLTSGARSLISFGASIFFVVLFLEAESSWRPLRDARRHEADHV